MSVYKFVLITYIITLDITSVLSECDENGTEVAQCQRNVDKYDDLERVKEFGGFYSFNETISLFTNKEYENDTNIQGLLKTFQRHCPFEDFIPISQKNQNRKFPFIVVEGMPRTTRNIVAKKLARKVRGKHVFIPPAFLLALGTNFNVTHKMRRAYFSLAVYGGACEIERVINLQPVVTAGYWIDQTAFSITLSFPEEPPPVGSPVYDWPVDLLVPDIIFFVNPPSPPVDHTNPLREINKQKKKEIYRRWRKPRVIEVNTTRIYNNIVDIIINHLNTTLDFTFDYQ